MLALLPALLLAAAPGLAAEEEVRAADLALDRAVTFGDAGAFGALLEEGAIFAGGRALTRGREAVVAAWRPLFGAHGPRLRWAPARAGVASSGDLAFTTGRWTLTAKGKDGKPVREEGEYATVWRRGADGAWRALLDAPLRPAAALGEGLARTPALSAASAAGDLEAAVGTWTRGVDEGGWLLVRRSRAGSWEIVVDSAFPFERPPPARAP